MLIIHGIARSRAIRCIWAAEEAGLPYRIDPVTFGPDSKLPAYLAVNPAGKIPALTDGDLVLTESLAIALHLAGKAGAPLMPTGDDASRVLQWTLWAATEAEPNAMRWAYNTLLLPPEQRDAHQAALGAAGLHQALARLEQHLAERGWLVGEAFSIADLNVAAVLYGSRSNGFDYDAYPQLQRWFDACLERPAAQRAMALRAA